MIMNNQKSYMVFRIRYIRSRAADRQRAEITRHVPRPLSYLAARRPVIEESTSHQTRERTEA